MQNPKKTAVIVAGGSGKRVGGEMPKQFIPIAGKPMLFYSIEAFAGLDSEMEIIVSLPEEFQSYWQELVSEYKFPIRHTVASGGSERFHSVQNALHAITGNEGLVAVHDAARPFISTDLLRRLFTHASEHGSAIPAVTVADSLRMNSDQGWKPVNRSDYRAIQTPQIFRLAELKEAYKQEYAPKFTDDATVMESAGYSISLTEGDEYAFKITTAIDVVKAEALAGGF
jgi:2-C-methyl-D-erythritol 4-phosphate cytidylyltransferase